MKASTRVLFIVALIIFLLGIVIWGLMLYLTWNLEKPHTLLTELGKMGASLSLITVIGALI